MGITATLAHNRREGIPLPSLAAVCGRPGKIEH
jgi:hypothetical protein